jgi:hypothetical protein
MSRKRMPGGVPEPGWTLEEHQQAVAQFHEGIANGLNPEWPPPRQSLMGGSPHRDTCSSRRVSGPRRLCQCR